MKLLWMAPLTLCLSGVQAQTSDPAVPEYQGEILYHEFTLTRHSCDPSKVGQTSRYYTHQDSSLVKVGFDKFCELLAEVNVENAGFVATPKLGKISLKNPLVVKYRSLLPPVEQQQGLGCGASNDPKSQYATKCSYSELDIVSQAGYQILAQVQTLLRFTNGKNDFEVKLTTVWFFGRQPDTGAPSPKVRLQQVVDGPKETRFKRDDEIKVNVLVCASEGTNEIATLGAFDQNGALILGSYFPGRLAGEGAGCTNTTANFKINETVTSFKVLLYYHEALFGLIPGRVLGVQTVIDERFVDGVKPDLEISWIQAIQVQDLRDDDQKPMPLVAGKGTVVRVFVRSVGGDDRPLYQITGELTADEFPGTRLLPVDPGDVFAPVEPPDPESDSNALNFSLPPEWTLKKNLTLRAKVDLIGSARETSLDNNLKEQTISFKVLPNWPEQFTVLRWPVGLKNKDGGMDYPSMSDDQEADQLAKLLPIDDLRFFYTTAPKLKFAKSFYDEKTPTKKTAQDLSRFLLKALLLNPRADRLMARTPTMLFNGFQYASADLFFHEIEPGGIAPIWWEPDFSKTPGKEAQTPSQLNKRFVSHGMGHTFGLSVPSDPSIGTGGYDFREMTVVPRSTIDIMTPAVSDASNDNVIWASQKSYRGLYEAQVLKTPGAQLSAKPIRSAEASEQLIVSGTANLDGTAGSLDPVQRISSTRPITPHDPKGTHCLLLQGAGGASSDYCFTPQFKIPDFPEAGFTVAVPSIAGLTRLGLRQGAKELTTLTSGATPDLNILEPRAGDQWSGTETIRWSATDPAGRPLTYTIQYSSDDGASWIPLALDLEETQYEVDTSEMAGGKKMRLRITAMSGLDNAVKDVGPFEFVQNPKLTVSPARLDFSNVSTGQFQERQLTLHNPGTGPVRVSVKPPENGAFQWVGQAEFLIDAGGTRSLPVRFHPSRSGIQQGTLTVESADPERPSVRVPLSGTAFDSLIPNLTIDATKLEFGTVNAGRTKEMAVTIRNTGSAPLQIASIESSSVRFRANLPLSSFTLSPGSSIAAPIAFSPVRSEPSSGTVTIVSNDPSRPRVTIQVSGNGLLEAGIGARIVTPDSGLDFGDVMVGQSKDLLLTLRNTGDRTLQVTSVTATEGFSPIVSFVFFIPPNGQYSMNVRFSPTSKGGAFGRLIVTSSDPSIPTTSVDLRGTGI